jgi:cellulose synthase/poly-beta-1,6-N-acetylglucosamine synthase-like glycosyltransferase
MIILLLLVILLFKVIPKSIQNNNTIQNNNQNNSIQNNNQNNTNGILIAILAKDKSVYLPVYLNSIYNQCYDKKNIHLYIRTNDNRDNTSEILKEFIKEHSHEYASIFFD